MLCLQLCSVLAINMLLYFQGTDNGFMFYCAVCNSNILLNEKENDFVSCSNAHRHLSKVCWLNRKRKENAKKKQTLCLQKSTVTSFFNKTSKPESPPFITTCMFTYNNTVYLILFCSLLTFH